MGASSNGDGHKFLRTAEAAERLGVTQRTVTRWVDKRILKGFKVNPRAKNSPYLVAESAVEAMLEERRSQLAGGPKKG